MEKINFTPPSQNFDDAELANTLPTAATAHSAEFAQSPSSQTYLDNLANHQTFSEQFFNHEQLGNIEFSIPLTDVLKSPRASAEIWPDLAEQLVPQIEQRQYIAAAVNQYLDRFYAPEQITPELQQAYWQNLGSLLQNPDYERIALFLPFESLPDTDDHSRPAQEFRQNYLSAWQNLLFTTDIRENFNLGDIPEADAAQSAPARVVKAAHLAPWLVQKDFIQTDDILDILEAGVSEPLTRSFLETVPMLRDFGYISDTQQQHFDALTRTLPPQAPALPPKYISPERQSWLAERAQYAERPTDFTPALTELAQPLSARINQLEPELNAAAELAATLDPVQTTGVVVLSGSRLKGYGRDTSDVDLYTISYDTPTDLVNAHNLSLRDISLQPYSHASSVFDAIWVGAETKVRELQRELGPLYFQETDEQVRRWSTERLEQDLLEYRLLHKGYARLCPDTNPEYKKYSQMDGASSFYETGFRVIATKIYANSIFIPKIAEEG